jgi:hypothetical protein
MESTHSTPVGVVAEDVTWLCSSVVTHVKKTRKHAHHTSRGTTSACYEHRALICLTSDQDLDVEATQI